jgi:hypothetical protein
MLKNKSPLRPNRQYDTDEWWSHYYEVIVPQVRVNLEIAVKKAQAQWELEHNQKGEPR